MDRCLGRLPPADPRLLPVGQPARLQGTDQVGLRGFILGRRFLLSGWSAEQAGFFGLFWHRFRWVRGRSGYGRCCQPACVKTSGDPASGAIISRHCLHDGLHAVQRTQVCRIVKWKKSSALKCHDDDIGL